MKIEFFVMMVLVTLFMILMVLFCCKSSGQREIETGGRVILKKLCSRKLWVAVGAFLTTMCVTWGVDDITTEQLSGTCIAIASLVAYIGAEGYADGHSPTNKDDTVLHEEESNG
ncbi:MAG: hypothetical protein R3Y63_04225 [Eubacteriales bacterium]